MAQQDSLPQIGTSNTFVQEMEQMNNVITNTNQVYSDIGNVQTLETSATTIVAAINEVNANSNGASGVVPSFMSTGKVVIAAAADAEVEEAGQLHYVLGTGSLGIGTVVPGAQLEVHSASGTMIIAKSNTGACAIELSAPTNQNTTIDFLENANSEFKIFHDASQSLLIIQNTSGGNGDLVEIDVNGQINLTQDGSAGGLSIVDDCILYRHGANFFRTSDSLIVDASLIVGGTSNGAHKVNITGNVIIKATSATDSILRIMDSGSSPKFIFKGTGEMGFFKDPSANVMLDMAHDFATTGSVRAFGFANTVTGIVVTDTANGSQKTHALRVDVAGVERFIRLYDSAS